MPATVLRMPNNGIPYSTGVPLETNAFASTPETSASISFISFMASIMHSTCPSWTDVADLDEGRSTRRRSFVVGADDGRFHDVQISFRGASAAGPEGVPAATLEESPLPAGCTGEEVKGVPGTGETGTAATAGATCTTGAGCESPAPLDMQLHDRRVPFRTRQCPSRPKTRSVP